jgi:hypothetical protein
MFSCFHPHDHTPLYPYPLNRESEDPIIEFNNTYDPILTLRTLTQSKVKLQHGILLAEWATLNYLTNPTFRERVPYFKPSLFPKGDLSIASSEGSFNVPLDLSKLPEETLFKLITPELLKNPFVIRSFYHYFDALSVHQCRSYPLLDLPNSPHIFSVGVNSEKYKTVPQGSRIYLQRHQYNPHSSYALHVLGRSQPILNTTTHVATEGEMLLNCNTPYAITVLPTNLLEALEWPELPSVNFETLPLYDAFKLLGMIAPSPAHKKTLTVLKQRLRKEYPSPAGNYKPEEHIPAALRAAGFFEAYFGDSLQILKESIPLYAPNKGDHPCLIIYKPKTTNESVARDCGTFYTITFPTSAYFDLRPVPLVSQAPAHCLGLSGNSRTLPTEIKNLCTVYEKVRSSHINKDLIKRPTNARNLAHYSPLSA